MRVLLVSAFGHRIGGIEVHLQRLIPALASRGWEVGCLFEHRAPPDGEPIAPPGVPVWVVEDLGSDEALRQVRAWKPEVIYAHQVIDARVLEPLQREAPACYFAHCYVGVCISGGKCWKWPVPRVCERRLGWACLIHYLPHRCGGLHPGTMWKLFQEQRRSLETLRRFRRVATHSEHVRQEYLRHGFPESAVVKIPFWVPGEPRTTPEAARARGEEGFSGSEPVRLLFLGRFEVVKGGAVLIEALPGVAERLGRPVELTLAGEGPEEGSWKKIAADCERRHPQIRIRFPGWLGGERKVAALTESHLLVMPSLWPEPFGMSGVEAGFHGVPSVAFDVGGIREWLRDGVNGHLADGRPPAAGGLAKALIAALEDPRHYAELRAGAVTVTRDFGEEPHLAAVEQLLQGGRPPMGEWNDRTKTNATN
jgi:glycosyltransferase involved in cell wall biosynthesis